MIQSLFNTVNLYCDDFVDFRDLRSGGGDNSHRLGYGMCHFLRVLFWLKNKFLGLFYSF